MLYSAVPSNTVYALTNTELLANITFDMLLAVKNHLRDVVLLQLRRAFTLAVLWVMWYTPEAVISLIAGAFATNQPLFHQLGDVGFYGC